MRLDQCERHLPVFPCPRHAGVSPEALGAQSLVDSYDRSDVHHNSDAYRDVDHDHSAVYNDNNHSIGPITTSSLHHGGYHKSFPLLRLQPDVQLTLFAAWNHLLSLQ